MPFACATHPSIGLSLLKAALHRVGIESQIIYANLEFAERAGLHTYAPLDQSSSDSLVGEWVFSPAAFREQSPEAPGFAEQLEIRVPSLTGRLTELRRLAVDFIEELAQRLAQDPPTILGCSSTFQQNCASLALLRRVKELCPEVITVMGGANCEGPMGQALVANFPYLDYVLSGEADEAFPRLCEVLLGRLSGVAPERIYGVISRHNLQDPPPRASLANLDSLPLPDFDDYFQALAKRSFAAHTEPGLLFESSRGCWWGQKHHCTFCGLNGQGMGYRAKSPQRVLSEMAELAKRYGVYRFEVCDNILAMEHLREVLPQLAQQNAPYLLFYETKSNLKRAQVELLARSGVRWIQPGIESLHDGVLALMDKGATGLINLQLLRNAREYGIHLFWNFLFGFPGEDPAWGRSVAAWLPRIVHLQPPSCVVWVRIDRFSPHHENPERYGLRLQPNPRYRMVYPLPDSELEKLAYYFVGDPGGPELQETFRELDAQVKTWRALWNATTPPLLNFVDDGERLDLLDTRPLARRRRMLFDGLERELILACETPQNQSTLAERWGEAVRAMLPELVADGVILELEGRYLTLAVPGMLPSLPRPEDFPGGSLFVDPVARRYRGSVVRA